ncbi:MAG TPA: amidohydrolase family protein [Rubricoccaceae bacterium]|nr:amidohydrolase family protein [Rubricoccaceae bacterium]
MHTLRRIGWFFTLLAAFPPAAAQPADSVVAYVGAEIHPISGPMIERGVLVVEGRHIVAVGAEGAVTIPDGARQVDLTGKVLLPGLVDTHSHIGEGDGGDASGPLHPDARILDALDPRADSFMKARAGGITTVNVMPGSGHLMSGQTAYLKLRRANTIEGMLYCDDPLTGICGGMKMANGTNSLRGTNGFPGTRARSAALVRDLFYEALAYRDGRRSDTTKARDLRMEALLEVLDGRRIVHFHTHRHDDILTALRLAREFGFRPVLHHVSEGWRVAEEIAAAGAPASIIVLDSPGGKLEAQGLLPTTGAALEQAGVDVAYHTDDYITDSRFFLRSAALGVRSGMSREKALEAVTLAGARMLGLADRVGSLEPGKDADFIVLSGDPLSTYTHVEQTYVEGRLVFDRSDAADRPYAVGGYDVYRSAGGHHED